MKGKRKKLRLLKEGKELEKEMKETLTILRKRNFKGYKGLVIKNTIYQFLTNITGKLGSLVFTIIIARLLLPELFGLYSLALSTIILFAAFTDLGIGSTFIRFVSKALGRNKKREAKSYAMYLTKIKIFLTLVTAIALILTARFIANSYYNKPIFLALVAGSLYLSFTSLLNLITLFFHSANNFRWPFFREIFFQISRLVIVPLTILLALKFDLSKQLVVFSIILALAFTYFLTVLFISSIAKKKLDFLKVKPLRLRRKERKRINRFIITLSVTVLSGIFFGYIDMIMLGHFVDAEFIGYYKAAFALVGGISALVPFSAVLFPLFSRLKGKELEKSLAKSTRITLLFSSIIMILVVLFASPITEIVYGTNYLSSVPLLRLLSLLLISLPLTSLLSSYFIARGKPEIVAKLLVISTILNVVLNYVFIAWLIHYSQFLAVVGACIATLLSRYFYFISLTLTKRLKIR